MPTCGMYGSCQLGAREQRVVELVAAGLTNKEIGKKVGTTEHVVKNYLRVIFDKAGVWSRLELALWHEARRNPSQQTSESLASHQRQ